MFCFFGKRPIFSLSIRFHKLRGNLRHVKIPCHHGKPTLLNLKRFGNADRERFNNYHVVNPFQPICHGNINKVCEEIYQYLDQMMKFFVPMRTWHRQGPALWINSHTSKLLKLPKTKNTLLDRKPSSDGKQQIQKLENPVTDFWGHDRKNY